VQAYNNWKFSVVEKSKELDKLLPAKPGEIVFRRRTTRRAATETHKAKPAR
jgi:hypothetical protein